VLLATLAGAGVAVARQDSVAPASGATRAWIGVFVGDAVDGGVQLIAIVPGSPAARSGLQVGDVVVEVEQLRLVDVADLASVLDGIRPGDPLQLRVLRSGRMLERVVEPAERPPSPVLVSSVVRAPVAPRPPPPPVAVEPRGCRAYGLAVAELTPDLRRHLGAPAGEGLLVTRIDPERPAALDGFRVGDVLVRLGDAPVRLESELERILQRTGGGTIRATLVREGRPTAVTLRATTVPDRPTREAQQTAYELQRAASRAETGHSVRVEIERLERRIEQLKRELEELVDDAAEDER